MTILVYLCVLVCICAGMARLIMCIYNELRRGHIKEIHYSTDSCSGIEITLRTMLRRYPRAVVYFHSDSLPPYEARLIAGKENRIQLDY